MRALVLDQVGSPDTLRMGEIPCPSPGPGEIRVKIHACGLNPSDYQRAAYGVPEWEWPAVLGLDVVGTVDAIGDAVSNLQIGDRVVFHGDIRNRGGLAEYAVGEARVVAVVPPELDLVAAAALPAAGLTAYHAINQRLRIEAGDTVLITGAAGGVGGFAVQLATLAGARVIATESAQNAERARSLGAETVIDFLSEDISSRVRELTDGRGVDAVLDTIGADSATENIQLLAFGGRIATVAGRADLSVVPPFSMAPSVHEIALGAAYTVGNDKDRVNLAEMLTVLLQLAASGQLDPMVSSTIPLEGVPTALTELSTRQLSGKIVATV
ncbi:zinc-binding dehydrogenase [Rhodococcus koreensis]